MPKNWKDETLVKCEVCNGTGFDVSGLACDNCNGLGFGTDKPKSEEENEG